ncbi:putative DNA-binding protein SNT1 [Hanseniaspora osmophila]|uniref:Putative DNA-binding protein SNT1 n=1 Tax=Hanseniaspora osmophila TaxID=56408 RepID=A0A1E5RGK5_9ASCO|nr:putative DNA-binding protein SNT1 [Hanseniaspora osmophila]
MRHFDKKRYHYTGSNTVPLSGANAVNPDTPGRSNSNVSNNSNLAHFKHNHPRNRTTHLATSAPSASQGPLKYSRFNNTSSSPTPTTANRMADSLSDNKYAHQPYSPNSKARYAAHTAYKSVKPATLSGSNQHNTSKTTPAQQFSSNGSVWSRSTQSSHDSVGKMNSMNQSGTNLQPNLPKHRIPGGSNTYVPSMPKNDEYIPAKVNQEGITHFENSKNSNYHPKNTYRSRFDSSAGSNKNSNRSYAFPSEKTDQIERRFGLQESSSKKSSAQFPENTTTSSKFSLKNNMPMSKKNFKTDNSVPQSKITNRVSKFNHERKNRFGDNFGSDYPTKNEKRMADNQEKEENTISHNSNNLSQNTKDTASSPSSKGSKSHKPSLISSGSVMEANNEHATFSLSTKQKNYNTPKTDSTINGNEYTGGSKFIRSSSVSNALSELQRASDVSDSETDLGFEKNKTDLPSLPVTAHSAFTALDLNTQDKASNTKSTKSSPFGKAQNENAFAKTDHRLSTETANEPLEENENLSTAVQAAKTGNEENMKAELGSKSVGEESQPLKKSSSILFNSDEDKKENEQDFDELLSSTLEGVPEKDFKLFYYDAPFKSTKHIPKQLSFKESPLPVPKVALEECIFPMREVELRLWILKNNPVGIAKQDYRMKTPIRHLNEYPFFYTNIERFYREDKTNIVESLCSVKRYAYLKSLKLRQKYVNQESLWKDKIVSKLDKLTEQHKSKEERNHEKKAQKEEERLAESGSLQANSSLSALDGADSGSSQGGSMSAGTISRRRNRADFVDEEDLESVLLQIDPYYKHHQLAADIPPMLLNPVDKYAKKYQDVNNLVTNKDQWAERIILDGELNFSELERTLFTEGYVQYPKLFSKISNYMGGLRTPEECVIYYYQTKNKCNYKQLLEEKKREKEREKAKRKLLKKMAKGDTSQNTPVKADVSLENGALSESVSAVDLNDKLSVLSERETQKTTNPHDLSGNSAAVNFQNSVGEIPAKPLVPSFEHDSRENQPTSFDGTDVNTHTEGSKSVDSAVLASSFNTNATDPEKATLVSDVLLKKTFLSDQVLDQTSPEANESHHIPKEQTNNVNVALPLAEDTPAGQNESMLIAKKRRSSSGTESAFPKLAKKQKLQNEGTGPGITASSIAKTSYWSVYEANLFPSLLQKHGSNWEAISKDIETKSVTMVKNFYQKRASECGWDKILMNLEDKKTKPDTQNIKSDKNNEKSGLPALFSLETSKQSSVPIQNSLPAVTKPSVQLFAADVQKHVLPKTESANTFFNDTDISLQGLPAPRLPSIQLPSIFPKGESSFNVFGSAQSKQSSAAANNLTSFQLPPIEPHAKTGTELRPIANEIDNGRSASSATPTRKSFDIGNLLNEPEVVHRPVLRTFVSHTNPHSRSGSKSPSPVDPKTFQKNKSPPRLTFLSNILNPSPLGEQSDSKPKTFDNNAQTSLNGSFTNVNNLLNPIKPFVDFGGPFSAPTSSSSSQGAAVSKPTIVSNPAVSQAVLTATIHNPMNSPSLSVTKPHLNVQNANTIMPPKPFDAKPKPAFGNLNFAMDPLAALAAVASSESKLLNEKEDSQSKQQSTPNP